MPWLVVLTSIAAPASAAWCRSQPSAVIGPPSSFANACAPAAVGCAVGALGAVAMLRLEQWHPLIALGVLLVVAVPVLLRHAIRAR